MSQRGKRPNTNALGVEGSTPVKRRKGRPPTASIDTEDFATPSTSNGGGHNSSSVWQARPHLDLKMSSIYNRSAPEAPAELFRKDLISAMKLPDSEPLSHEEYWVITDQWKQEWERGVQVPVNPDSLPEPIVRSISENYYKGRQDFKLPKNKYIRITKDENFSHDKNYLSNTPAMADSVCSYDLDQLDEAWLKEFNGERSLCGLPPVNEEQFERIIEELETRCHDKIQAIMKSEDGLGIEYDETVICDVCRSPDSEDANEMVFCDNCNICVHQACYGITTIPSGNWLCRTCSMGQKPDCVLCPNKGGAMKSTRSGQKWAHVSCALWIPEVSIGSVDRMEPITKISSIPQSRWALVCVLCRERVGACIQCSVKTCKTAYHVTCAFQHGLEMRAIIEDENAEDGVKLRSYCQKHSVKKEPKNSANAEKASASVSVSASEDEEKVVTNNKNKIRKEMTTEERNHARLTRLVEIQSEFDKHVSVKDISCHLLDVDQEGINHIYNYWILKRKAGGNDPLLLPKAGDVDVMSQTDQEQADIEKMKMFVHLRQDLERVRNLCYMVSRREKLSRSFFKMREQIFQKQIAVLSCHKKTTKLDDASIKATMEANHGPSIYDVLYSSKSVRENAGVMRIEEMIDSILGHTSNKSNKEINGNVVVRKDKQDAVSRYSKLFNGGTNAAAVNKKLNNIYDSLSSDSDVSSSKHLQRRKSHLTSSSLSASSASTSEDELPPTIKRKSPVKSKVHLPPPPQQTSIVVAPSSTQPKKKGRPPGSTKQAVAEKRRQMNALNSTKDKTKSFSVDSSSEDDNNTRNHKNLRTRPLTTDDDQNMHLTDESDELVPIRNSSGHSIPTTGNAKRIQSSAIYSDSDSSSSDKDNKTDHTVSDSQQQPFRTKAAMKEFNINEILPFDKAKKKVDVETVVETSKKVIGHTKKFSALSPTSTTTAQNKKIPPVRRESTAKASRRISRTKQITTTSLSSDSEVDDVPTSTTKSSKDNNKTTTNRKKEIPSDFLVVPQREAAKKASENLMKTNSALMVQSISGTASEKNRREIREKLDETVMSSKVGEIERENQKESKVKSASKKDSKKSKEETKKETKKEKVDIKATSEVAAEKEKEDKVHTDFATDFLPYVPQRQAAKKAAEHIKGLGTSQPLPVSLPVEEKVKSSLASTKKATSVVERRKSVAVDLSSSSTSSTSSGSDTASSSESESEQESHSKATEKVSSLPTKASTKSLPARRPSAAVGLKPKPKDSPFLDKAAKSSVVVESSSSSSSSDSDSSTSDRPNTTRLSEKGNNHKGRASTKKSPSKKSSASTTSSPVKKEIDKSIATPKRRTSTIAKASSTTTSTTSNRSPQKSLHESTATSETSAVTSSRKRSTSIATSSSKVSSNNNKSRTTESSKGDLVKLPDKGQSCVDVNEVNENVGANKKSQSSLDLSNKKRKTSVAISSPTKDEIQDQVKEQRDSTLRRSSRSEQISTTKVTAQEKSLLKSPKIHSSLDSSPSKSKEAQKLLKTPTKKSPTEEVSQVKLTTASEDKTMKKVHDEKKNDVDRSEVTMDIDESLAQRKIISENKLIDIKESILKPPISVGAASSSPMVSIPTANLNNSKTSSDEAFNKILQDDSRVLNTPKSIFLIDKVAAKEDTERETLTFIEKLRQRKPNVVNIADNNNIVNDKIITENPIKLSPCMHQNENKNTPKREIFDPHQQQQQQVTNPQQQQPVINKAIGSPSPVISKKDQEFNDLKKTSPWHQQSHLSSSGPDNNYQRNILTSSTNNNNKMNSAIEQPPAPASCMVIEHQQKLAACQKINEENNMLASNRGTNMFLPPVGINTLNEQPNHMEIFNMQMQQHQQQQQKWSKEQKSTANLKMMQQQQSNVVKRNQPGMENVNLINDLNQQFLKNATYQQFPHKGPMTNDFSASMHPHNMPGSFNSFNFSDNASQFTGAVSLFPPADMNVQVPFPSPGQAMFAPNFTNNFTNTPQPQSNVDHPLMMPSGLQNKPNSAEMMSNNLRFGAQQNFCAPTITQQSQQQQQLQSSSSSLVDLGGRQQKGVSDNNPNNEQNVSEKVETQKKSPSKSTRSSPRNSTPTHVGVKTPQKSPSKSPRQPSTPALTVEPISRQNSTQKGKTTPNINETTKQRKSRTNSQASPASTPSEHRGVSAGTTAASGGGKGRGRGSKNSKTRFPQTTMPFIPFSGNDYVTINKKLVGTVYDFSADDEFNQTSSVENLRAMRDRTKSVDIFNKLNTRDTSSQSPKTTKASIKQQSSIQNSSSSSSSSTTLTINNHRMNVTSSSAIDVVPSTITDFVNIPGPVDMRTYNSYDSTNDSYNSQLLGAFASNTVDQTLNEIDEEQEKELQTALKASNDKQKTPTNAITNDDKSQQSLLEMSNIVEESVDSEASFAKVSLSDSRNQLKLKIKGPLAHPDLHFNASVNPIVPQNISSGASKRQMRKKELLQQYWNQGLNIDQEQPNPQSVEHHTVSNLPRIGGIPKAVDSMSLGLLKDEFQDFNYAEYKKRKRFALDVDIGTSNNSNVSNAVNDIDPIALDYNKKRRNRANRGGQQQMNTMNANPPPKLKIKIGSDIMETSGSDLPPKKRHIAAPPSYQDLKRDSMNFRKKMMDEFSEEKNKEHRTKEEKREKKDKKKKKEKKEKKKSVEIVHTPVVKGAPVKLILKIGNKSMSTVSNTSAENSNSSELNKSAPPLKLKISRSSQGNGEYNILNTKDTISKVTEKQQPTNVGNSSIGHSDTMTMVTSTPVTSSSNNNLQPPIIDASDIKKSFETKKLEVSLERLEDNEKSLSFLKGTTSTATTTTTTASNENSAATSVSKDCEVR